ncbi:MAG: PhzF family phenazine biosynthesis protein, partial [Deltaproteobacteria bacterium]|nr:PhzF family phenazine biosynthesis protein [Deltaproteobacteria bacterium]
AVIQTVSTGTRQLMVPLRRHDSLKRVMMNVPAYREYREQCGFFSPHLFCLGGISADAQTFARHPGMAPDTAEDAFTGSATGGMAVAGHAVTVVAGTLTI